MISKKLKITVGSRTYEVEKKHLVYAAIGVTAYIAVMYRNRCSDLSIALAKAEAAKMNWKNYGEFVTDHSLASGIATMVESNGKQSISFAYEN